MERTEKDQPVRDLLNQIAAPSLARFGDNPA